MLYVICNYYMCFYIVIVDNIVNVYHVKNGISDRAFL